MARRKDKGRSYVVPEDVLARAHSRHMDGESARQLAIEFFDQCFSGSPKALSNAFLTAWRARGWEVRGRREATTLSNRRRGFRPQCSHVMRLGPRKGRRCDQRCVNNDMWCAKHHPDRVAAGIARVRALEGRDAA